MACLKAADACTAEGIWNFFSFFFFCSEGSTFLLDCRHSAILAEKIKKITQNFFFLLVLNIRRQPSWGYAVTLFK